MTAIISILCTDGVVVAADSAATFAAGQRKTIEQPFDKIEIIRDAVIVAGTGQIGMGQRFCACVLDAWPPNPKTDAMTIAKSFTIAARADFAATGAVPGQYGALVAFGAAGKPQVVEFPAADLQPETKSAKLWYASMGSGQTITDPFLAFMRQVFWNEGQPALQEGIFAATWVLQHAIDCNTGGVNGPLRVAVLEWEAKGKCFGARTLSEAEVGQHLEHVAEAKQYLRDFKNRHKPEAGVDLPPVPNLTPGAR